MFGWDDVAIVGFLVGEYVYHRWIDPANPPPPPKPARSLAVPKTAAGTAYPLVYGRTRVHTPVVTWVSKPKVTAGSGVGASNAPFVYGADMLLAAGIPFDGGSTKVLQMWAGELLLGNGAPGLSGQTGHGGTGGTDTCIVGSSTGLDGSTGPIYGLAEVLDGRSTQQLVDGSGTALTFAGQRMKQDGVDAAQIPGYRNLVSVFLCSPDFTNASGYRWWVGSSPQIDTYSLEVESLPSTWLGPHQQVASIDGDVTHQDGDVNPIDVLYDLLTGVKGKLGLDPGRIGGYGIVTFQAAAATLDAEGNGFSRCWDSATSARDMIAEILRQVDGVLYEDPYDGNIKIKLIRDDYTVSALPLIDPSNCEGLQNFAAGGWTGSVNKVRVNYSNRADEYRTASATAQNQANAVGQDGEVVEVTVDMPGVCEESTARELAGRELAARSRPLMKCSAVVNRSFYQVCPGDAVRLSWPEYGLSNVVFRVASVNRGTLQDGRIRLDLIQDYFYVWRQSLVVLPTNPIRTGGSLALRP